MEEIETHSEYCEGTFKTILCERDTRGVLAIQLNRPEVRNAFNAEMICELSEAFKNNAMHASVRAVTLCGRNDVFCSGGDLRWMQQAGVSQDNYVDALSLALMLDTIQQLPKPVIATVQGVAVGGAVGLLAVSDMVISEAGVLFSIPEATLGLVPACIAPFVLNKIGPSHTRSLFMTARRITATEALRMGLIHEIATDLEAARASVLDSILDSSGSALATVKTFLNDLIFKMPSHSDSLTRAASILAAARSAAETRKRIMTFMSKAR